MKDLSIEYAHIYTNDQIGQEHEISIETLKKVKKTAEDSNQTVSLLILIDDYSFPDPTFDYNSFSLWLSERGFKPDLILRESQLIPVCDEVISKLSNEKMKNELEEYVKAKKYPCSLFIAAWYLLRLGFIESPLLPKDLVGKRLHNILPSSFKPFEDKGLEIIANTEYSGAEKSVDYSFIEGRDLA